MKQEHRKHIKDGQGNVTPVQILEEDKEHRELYVRLEGDQHRTYPKGHTLWVDAEELVKR